MRLSTSSYAILGMVAVRGPSTPYEIKRALGRLTAEFWAVPHTQCYAETERLAAAGLLALDQEEAGRRRRVYSLTADGRAALQAWLLAPDTPSMAIRDEAEFKLFCGELLRRDDLIALARQQAESYRQRLLTLEALEERFAGRDDLIYRMAPARLGRRVYEAARSFWADLADELANDTDAAADGSTVS